MTEKNLWGDLGSIKLQPTPLSILKEQAGLLDKLTGGVLLGKVAKGIGDNEFSYRLDIVVPTLGGYSKTVLELSYDINIYPVKVVDYFNDRRFQCPDEASFKVALGEILASERTKEIIGTLISHIRK